MLNVALLDEVSLGIADLDLSSWFDLKMQLRRYATTTAQQLYSRMQDVEIVLTNKVVFDAEVLSHSQLERLKLIIVLGTGTNNIDLDAAKDREIAVCNMVDYSTESVAQHVMAFVLAQASKLFSYHHAIEDGAWQRSSFFGLLDYPTQELRFTSLGLIGYGAIAKRVEALAKAFGMEVMIADSLDPQGQAKRAEDIIRKPLRKILTDTDFISIHCPLTEHTRHLIAAPELGLMKKTAYIINTARGGIIDEQALYQALLEKRIAGAALDVLTEEPPDREHILLHQRLDNLIITPHSAWSSRHARQTLVNQTYRILKAWIEHRRVDFQRVI